MTKLLSKLVLVLWAAVVIALLKMTTYGRNLITTTGQPVQVTADGYPEWKVGGVTIDWSTIPAVAADTTLVDGAVIKAGYRGMQFGTILCKITSSGLYGPFSPAMTATSISGATAVGATSATLASGAHILPGDILTIDTAGQAETAQVLSVSGAVVTFVSPLTKTHADTVAVTKATNGRETLVAGECFVLNQTVLQSSAYFLSPGSTDHPAVLEGGSVFLARLAVGASNQPTLAQLLAVLPRLRIVEV